MIHIPAFKTQQELFTHLRENKQLYISAKKSEPKEADAVFFNAFVIDDTGTVQKLQPNTELLKLDSFNVKAAINTTNLMDSHSDVHIPGLWTKSIKERKSFYLFQEHKMQFDKIISDNVSASTKQMTWKELGQDYAGTTEVLVFDAAIEKGRNEYMSEQYAKGRVKNHSVGMQYVKLDLAINSNDKYDATEKATWDKYITQVANKTDAETQGYFWVVTEAKVVEGSAVPMGSNPVTPTISISETKTLETAGIPTDDKPLDIGKIAEAIKQSFKN
jgi:hypothetical protein